MQKPKLGALEATALAQALVDAAEFSVAEALLGGKVAVSNMTALSKAGPPPAGFYHGGPCLS